MNKKVKIKQHSTKHYTEN